ncbi:MAG: glycosyltransferase [Anaerolineae bacterium]
MLTPDSYYIDRRILQEAETLTAQGHEVTILAGWEAGLPLHEKIGSIQIERVTSSRFFWPDQIILSSQRQTIAFLNALSSGYQKLIGFFSWIAAKFFILLILIGTRLITLIAIGVNNLAALSLRLCQRLQLLTALEHEMLQRAITYRPDVIHIHDLPQLRVGVKAKKQLQIPLVYDAHELYAEIGALSAAAKQDLTYLEKQSIPHCYTVITVNPFIAAEMAQRYQIPQPMVILNAIALPNGFNPALTAKTAFDGTTPFPPTTKFCFTRVGYHWIGVCPTVQAMAQVPVSIHLILMGYGEEARHALEKIANETGSAWVHFKEAVSQNELLFWTVSADASIIPYQPIDLNNYYCSPNKLFEFIQAELPIIANDLPFLRQVVHEEGFGLTSPLTDASSYAQAIRVMFDPALGGPVRFKPNLSAKKSKYDWQVEAAKLLDLYAKLEVDKRRV